MVVCAGGLIIKDNKILLTKRSETIDTYPGYWTCPAGHAEEGESAEETAIREVREEVGLDFIPTTLFATGQWKDRELNRFLGEFSGSIKLQEEEVSEVGWFSYEEAMRLDLAFDYREVIEKLRKENIL